jgi:prolyl 4-hydroxylase
MKRINIKTKKNKNDKILIENENPHFIGAWNIENDDLCREIINFFVENKNLQRDGVTGSGKNQEIKKTTDIVVNPNDLKAPKFNCLNKYIKHLYMNFKDYQNQWPFIKNLVKEMHIGKFNIQRYTPGGHFAKVHTERSSIASSHRLFAWMTYLNNVDDGGTTHFSHYDIEIKPETGKTLIWPAEWTHAHNGKILNSGVKYIITGWLHFPHNSKS